MRLAKSITPKKISVLHGFRGAFLVLLLAACSPVFSQDNSPYSRYGIGDLVPSTNILSRSMGGISAAYSDPFSINFNNPASYSGFQAIKDKKSKKLNAGRAVLDVGVNFESRTLTEPGNPEKFTAGNALFSYVQVGVPLKKNWGLSFGLRPLSRISYKIFNLQRLVDPNTGLPIDSAVTRFEGDGGTYLASLGTGISLFSRERGMGSEVTENLSVGATVGYVFGKKDYSTRRTLINDTVDYYQANYQAKTNFGGLYVDAGVQYKLPMKNRIVFSIGAYGTMGRKTTATQDRLRETFVYDNSLGEIRLDSVSDLRNVKGKIEIPASYTFGVMFQKIPLAGKEAGWIIGADFTQQNWDNYRFYGQKDQLQNKWELRVGGQLNPVPKRNFFSNVAYRAGFFTGPDYVNVGGKAQLFGGSLGLGLPVAMSRQAMNQVTIINLGFEYIKRGNNDNLLKENMFRVSLGLSLSDSWFIKRKYD